jgi:hypothetical protein
MKKPKKKKSQQKKKRLIKKHVVTDKTNGSPQFHPTSMIPTLLKISDGSLDAAKEQLANMQLAQDKPIYWMTISLNVALLYAEIKNRI